MGSYTYDETNRMVKGVNDAGEQSYYFFNGLGVLVTNEWIIAKNNHGYHDVTPNVESPAAALENANDNNGAGHGNSSGKTSDVIKDFVIDYNSYAEENLMEYELFNEGLTYRYVYGVDKLGVTAYTIPNGSASVTTDEGDLPLYYHMDHMGSSEFLTSDVTQRITSWTSYDEWGNITHNAVLKCGERELDLVKTYTGHERDSVLGMYYAKARMYDTADKHGSTKANKLGDKRFTAVDPVKGDVRNPQTMVQYTYVINNPLMYTDPLGERAENVFDVISQIEILEKEIDKYSKYSKQRMNTFDKAELVTQFIRKNVYDSSSWDVTAGPIDEVFVAYVQKNNKKLYDYFEEPICVTGINSNIKGGTLDLQHFAATLNALLYTSTGVDLKATLVGEGTMNNLAGWAGDLQTLLIDAQEDLGKNASYQDIYNYVRIALVNKDDSATSFGYTDLLSDVDAYAIYKSMKRNSSLSVTMTNFYTEGYEYRYTLFANGLSYEEIKSLVMSFTNLKYGKVIIKWPLFSGVDEISPTMSKAVATAFADTIWESVKEESR